MTSALLLTAWVSSGVFTAARIGLPNESKWAWAPVAMILGPLWYSVAQEQRSALRAQPHLNSGDEEIDLAAMAPELRWIHEDHRMIPER